MSVEEIKMCGSLAIFKNYKLSKYNHFLELEDGQCYLLYNSISNGLARLEPEVFGLLMEGEKGIRKLQEDESKRDLIQMLYKGNIIHDGDFDEKEYLKAVFNMSRFGQKNWLSPFSQTSTAILNAYIVMKETFPGNTQIHRWKTKSWIS